jgi:4'-phosphopantetheinyl transferase
MHMTTFANPLVQLSYASLDILNDASCLAQTLSWLSLEERNRYKIFTSKQQANQYLLARALLRSQLSQQMPSVLPNEWVFTVDSYGKPRLADEFFQLKFRFNLSHSENLVVLAMSEGADLGVDVECIHRPVFSMSLARRYFAKSELADLRRLTEPLQVKRIAQLWTLKESYLKSNGLGVRVPLDKLEFRFEGDGDLSVSVSPSWVQHLPSEDHSFIGLFSLGVDYSLALTVEIGEKSKPPVLVTKEWTWPNVQLSGLQCNLLRKTDRKVIN